MQVGAFMSEKKMVPASDVILLGGGPSHLEAIRKYAYFKQKPYRLSLICDQAFSYPKSLLPYILSGNISVQDVAIDLGHLCTQAETRFFCQRVIHIDTFEKSLTLANGFKIFYDLISLDIGSQPMPDNLSANLAQISLGMHPLTQLLENIKTIEQQSLDRSSPFHLAISGGNINSFEIIWSLKQRFKELIRNRKLVLTFIENKLDKRIIPKHLFDFMIAKLNREGVNIYGPAYIVDYKKDEMQLVLSDNSHVPCRSLIWANIISAPTWLSQTNIKLDKNGFIRTLPNFESVSHPTVFACGESITLPGHTISVKMNFDKKMASILSENITRTFRGFSQLKYRPSTKNATIYLSNTKSLLVYSHLKYSSRFIALLTKKLEQKFWHKYICVPLPPRVSTYIESGQVNFAPIGGEGSRLPFDILKSCDTYQKNYVMGLPYIWKEKSEVSIAINLRNFTLNHFSFGQISINHLLNFLFCFGCKTADIHSNISIPYAPKMAMKRDFREFLKAFESMSTPFGITLKCINGQAASEASLSLLGKGFIETNLPAFLEITQPCDLILTKPLGTGIAAAGFQRYHVSSQNFLTIQRYMRQSHFVIGSILKNFNILSLFPIAGHGLANEAAQLMNENLIMEINLAKVPILPGVEQALLNGIRTSLHVQNRLQFTSTLETINKKWLHLAEVLFDPQTSGPVVVACHSSDTKKLLAELQNAGYSDAALIGEIKEKGELHHGKLIIRYFENSR